MLCTAGWRCCSGRGREVQVVSGETQGLMRWFLKGGGGSSMHTHTRTQPLHLRMASKGLAKLQKSIRSSNVISPFRPVGGLSGYPYPSCPGIFGEMVFWTFLPRLWNSLPLELKLAPSYARQQRPFSSSLLLPRGCQGRGFQQCACVFSPAPFVVVSTEWLYCCI